MSDPLPLPLRTKRERATEEVKSDSRVVSARTVSRRQSRFFPFARMPPYRRYMNQRPRYGSNYQLQRTIKRTIERQAEKRGLPMTWLQEPQSKSTGQDESTISRLFQAVLRSLKDLVDALGSMVSTCVSGLKDCQTQISQSPSQ